MVKLVINKENTVNANAVKRISWNDLTQFFQRMFSVHEVAEHFSLGKTKSSYTMLDDVALRFCNEKKGQVEKNMIPNLLYVLMQKISIQA